MQNNSILNKAKYSENTDEWYTDYSTVESELSHYIAKLSQEDNVIEIEETKTETMLNEINKIFIITGDDIE